MGVSQAVTRSHICAVTISPVKSHTGATSDSLMATVFPVSHLVSVHSSVGVRKWKSAKRPLRSPQKLVWRGMIGPEGQGLNKASGPGTALIAVVDKLWSFFCLCITPPKLKIS